MSAGADSDPRERRWTVARVREQRSQAEVLFHESARIYRLAKANPAYAGALRRLRAAAASREPVRVLLDAPNGDVVESVLP